MSETTKEGVAASGHGFPYLDALIHDAELDVAHALDGFTMSSRDWSEGVLAALRDYRDLRERMRHSSVRELRRTIWANLIAVQGYLDKPYPDDARWTPWTRFVARALRKVDELAEIAGGKSV